MTESVIFKRKQSKPCMPLYEKIGLKSECQNQSDRIHNAEKIRAGLPYMLFEDLRKMLGVNTCELSQFTGINDRSMERRQGGLLKAMESERLSYVAKLVDQAMFAFGYNEDGMREWFKEPNAMLLYYRPIDLLFSRESMEEVSILLERFADGDIP